MGQERLDGLAMLYYHHDVQITPEEVAMNLPVAIQGKCY